MSCFIRRALLLPLAGLMIAAGTPVATAGPGAPNGRILISESDLMGISSIRPDGSGYRLLIDAPHEATWGATWSPDKRRFAYYDEDDESEVGLYVANADGSDPTYVAPPGHFSWSPDSSYIAYTGVTRSDLVEGTCYGVLIVDVESLAWREVADAPDCRVSDVQWSPVGGELAFVDGEDGGATTADLDIYKVDILTGELTQLTDSTGVDRAPRWSPDGKLILFESSRDRRREKDLSIGCLRRTEIFVMRSDGTRQRRLTGNLRNPDCGASWSDNGRRITWMTFVAKDDDDLGRRGVIRVMRPDGSGKRRLTDPRRAISYFPVFSPDGRWVLFVSIRDLYKVRSDGSRQVRLTRRGERSGRVDW